MNAFRCTPDRSLDKVYLRTCAVYRMLKLRRIDRQRAVDLLLCPPKTRTGLVELWLAGPLRALLA